VDVRLAPLLEALLLAGDEVDAMHVRRIIGRFLD
jgi:hypothetical protein